MHLINSFEYLVHGTHFFNFHTYPRAYLSVSVTDSCDIRRISTESCDEFHEISFHVNMFAKRSVVNISKRFCATNFENSI